MANQLHDWGVSTPVTNTLTSLASLGIGAAVGGVQGGASAYNVDTNNRQLHERDRARIRKIAEQVTEGEDPEKTDQLEARLDNASCTYIHCAREYYEATPEHRHETARERAGAQDSYALSRLEGAQALDPEFLQYGWRDALVDYDIRASSATLSFIGGGVNAAGSFLRETGLTLYDLSTFYSEGWVAGTSARAPAFNPQSALGQSLAQDPGGTLAQLPANIIRGGLSFLEQGYHHPGDWGQLGEGFFHTALIVGGPYLATRGVGAGVADRVLPTQEIVGPYREAGVGGGGIVANTAARSEAAANIIEARNILRETRLDLTVTERNQIIKNFDLESFRVNTLSSPVTEFRYFDGLPISEGGASMSGRWSTTQWFETPAERITNLALPTNQATRAASVTLQPGTTVFQGTVAPQLNIGQHLTGGATQTYNVLGPRSIFMELP